MTVGGNSHKDYITHIKFQVSPPLIYITLIIILGLFYPFSDQFHIFDHFLGHLWSQGLCQSISLLSSPNEVMICTFSHKMSSTKLFGWSSDSCYYKQTLSMVTHQSNSLFNLDNMPLSCPQHLIYSISLLISLRMINSVKC